MACYYLLENILLKYESTYTYMISRIVCICVNEFHAPLFHKHINNTTDTIYQNGVYSIMQGSVNNVSPLEY